MEFLSELWMPIVVSSVFVFIASFFIHVVLPVHKGEWGKVPNEDSVRDALRGAPPGQYMIPFGTMEDMKDPAFQEKMNQGPNGTIVLWSGPVQMGKKLAQTFLFYLVVGVFVAYIGWFSLPDAPEYLKVFQICGAAAFMGHGLGWIPNMIWYGGSSRCFWTYLFDSIVYTGLTAGTFGWLWPTRAA